MGHFSNLARGMFARRCLAWGAGASLLLISLSACELFIHDPGESGGSGGHSAMGNGGVANAVQSTTDSAVSTGSLGEASYCDGSLDMYNACVGMLYGSETAHAGIGPESKLAIQPSDSSNSFYIAAVFAATSSNIQPKSYNVYAASIGCNCTILWSRGAFSPPSPVIDYLPGVQISQLSDVNIIAQVPPYDYGAGMTVQSPCGSTPLPSSSAVALDLIMNFDFGGNCTTDDGGIVPPTYVPTFVKAPLD